MEIVMKAFVYGSIKHGLPNHRVLGTSEFICSTFTTDKYDMVSMGGFPAVKESVGVSVIQGEVYEINKETLERLDHLESNGLFYARKLIKVDQVNELVWIYFIMNEMGSGEDKTNVHDEYGVQTWMDY